MGSAGSGRSPGPTRFLRAVSGHRGLFAVWVRTCPLRLTRPNAPALTDLLGTITLAVLAGQHRYAHVSALRADTVNPQGLGMSQVCSEDSVRRAFVYADRVPGAGAAPRPGVGRVAVVAGWPRMRAWSKPFRGSWRPFRPEVDLRRNILLCTPTPTVSASPFSACPRRLRAPRDYENIKPQVVQFMTEHLPSEVKDAAAPFSYRTWHIMVLPARCGSPGLDLIRTNPALAFMLASAHVFMRRKRLLPWDQARRLLGRRQREIRSFGTTILVCPRSVSAL